VGSRPSLLCWHSWTRHRSPTIAIYRQDRQRDLAIGKVMVDPFGGEIFASLINFHRFDGSILSQLTDNIFALRISVRICGVGDLKRKASEGQPGVPGAGAYPRTLSLSGGRSAFRQKSAVPQVARGTRCKSGARNSAFEPTDTLIARNVTSSSCRRARPRSGLHGRIHQVPAQGW